MKKRKSNNTNDNLKKRNYLKSKHYLKNYERINVVKTPELVITVTIYNSSTLKDLDIFDLHTLNEFIKKEIISDYEGSDIDE